MRRGLLLSAALALLTFLLAMALGLAQDRGRAAMAGTRLETRPTLVLDAGHGGEDGGAVSLTGVPESGINLDIVLKLEDLLAFCGTRPVLLRREDTALYDAGCVTLREKKVSDLQNRVKAVRAVEDAVLLSIHQNSFPEEKYRGSQTFYASTEGSEALAEHIQGLIRENLQPDNLRECRPIPDTVYLMNHVDCPAVLLECGFLTNPEEEARLRDPNYQKSLAAVLTAAWLTADLAGTAGAE